MTYLKTNFKNKDKKEQYDAFYRYISNVNVDINEAEFHIKIKKHGKPWSNNPTIDLTNLIHNAIFKKVIINYLIDISNQYNVTNYTYKLNANSENKDINLNSLIQEISNNNIKTNTQIKVQGMNVNYNYLYQYIGDTSNSYIVTNGEHLIELIHQYKNDPNTNFIFEDVEIKSINHINPTNDDNSVFNINYIKDGSTEYYNVTLNFIKDIFNTQYKNELFTTFINNIIVNKNINNKINLHELREENKLYITSEQLKDISNIQQLSNNFIRPYSIKEK